ncbi:MAG: chemotaxis protein CheB, partial [Methanobacteriota archaeon]
MSKKEPESCSPMKQQGLLPDKKPDSCLPIVGIGASAGGLEAFELFFRHISIDSGIAFILVSHLDPNHASMLAEILGRITKMPVVEAEDQMDVQSNHVYIIPPNREMAIFHRTIQLTIPQACSGHRMKIDLFLRSLAKDQGDKAIGIIFSGTGTDGTLGLRAIQGGGGITFVQDPKTAKYDGMPISAIQSGYATFVLPVEEIPGQLIASVKNLFSENPVHLIGLEDTVDNNEKNAVSRILRVIRSQTGHDFSQYKKSTIHRRIARRMSVHVIEDIGVYARYIEEHPDEAKTLFRELLINVTSFFRDPEAYEILKREVLPDLIRQKGEFDSFRVWVPGCATGEEADSHAIIIREILSDLGKDCKVQIYSTDIAEDVIASARKGFYPPNIAADVSSERLQKFFIRENNGYQVKNEIREMIIYATQNVIKDPPFTRLDLLSCRNLLIYLESELQSRLIPVFHYALNPGGILFLSSSESIGFFPDLFAPINQKWKIYQASGIKTGVPWMIESSRPWTNPYPPVPVPGLLPKSTDTTIVEMTRLALLQALVPPSVVTDTAGNILYVHGNIEKFLRPVQGLMSVSVIDMAREGLAPDLRTAIFTAITRKIPITSKNLQVRTSN